MEILSQMWSLLGLLTVLQNVLPSQLLSLLHSFYESLQDFLTPYSYFDIPEFNGFYGVELNDLYRHVHLYLNSLHNPTSSSSSTPFFCRRLMLTRSKSSNRVSFTVSPNHTVHDSFLGHRLSWTHNIDAVQDSLEEKRSFSLRLPKRHRQALLSPYLDSVTARAQDYERVSRQRRLFTNNRHAAASSYESSSGGWVSVPFRHPSTFETLALNPNLKKQITQDLTSFANAGGFYRSVGRAWKRGYLLYGPPGSGKSSLIAAMANFLCYDVYDLELTKVCDNSELRALLIQTTNRSIIVIEDIDCSVDLTADRRRRRSIIDIGEEEDEERNGRVTLSGLLNFTDGLWSCCGEERIIVFTTNRRDDVDAALVRCGRMDMHVYLGTCGIHAFKELVRNYLGGDGVVEAHVGLVEVVESCIRSGAGLTPAQVGEILLRNKRDAGAAIGAVISAMQAVILGGGEDESAAVEAAPEVCQQYGGEEEPPRSPVSTGERSPVAVVVKDGERKRKDHGSGWEKKVKFRVRLRSLTKSDSERREI